MAFAFTAKSWCLFSLWLQSNTCFIIWNIKNRRPRTQMKPLRHTVPQKRLCSWKHKNVKKPLENKTCNDDVVRSSYSAIHLSAVKCCGYTALCLIITNTTVWNISYINSGMTAMFCRDLSQNKTHYFQGIQSFPDHTRTDWWARWWWHMPLTPQEVETGES